MVIQRTFLAEFSIIFRYYSYSFFFYLVLGYLYFALNHTVLFKMFQSSKKCSKIFPFSFINISLVSYNIIAICIPNLRYWPVQKTFECTVLIYFPFPFLSWVILRNLACKSSYTSCNGQRKNNMFDQGCPTS